MGKRGPSPCEPRGHRGGGRLSEPQGRWWQRLVPCSGPVQAAGAGVLPRGTPGLQGGLQGRLPRAQGMGGGTAGDGEALPGMGAAGCLGHPRSC